MKLPYESPEVNMILFRALERLAADEDTGPEIDLGGPDISDVTGGVDWEWPET